MSTTQEDYKNNFKLAQYFNLWEDGQAKLMFSKEFNVNHQYSDSQDSKFRGYTALHFAAEHKHSDDMKFLLSRDADPTIKNGEGLTPLHLAIKDNCERLDYFEDAKYYCKLLLSAQVNLRNLKNPNDKDGLSHFHIACMADHTEAVEFFLKNGVSVDQAVGMDTPMFAGYTPLHLAAKYLSLQATKMLLEYGANTELKNSQEMTFVCTAFQVRTEIMQTLFFETHSESVVREANLELLKFLLQSDSYPFDYKNLNHFHLACSTMDLSIAERFLQDTTDINHALDMDALHWPGYTALHFAGYSSIEIVKMLVKNGANILAKDAKGRTPLDICLDRYAVADIHAVLCLDITWKNIVMSDGKTTLLNLIFAIKDVSQFNNFIEPRPHLVNAYVPLNSPIWPGFTALHVVVMFYDHYGFLGRRQDGRDPRSEHILEALVAKGANVNAQDIHGRTPIHLAYRSKCRAVYESLLRFRDGIEDVVDDENLSHLHIACWLNGVRAVEKILQTCADVNVAFQGQLDNRGINRGSTPLHIVADNDEIVALLLERGADPYLRDADGWTAIHRSQSRCNALLSVPNLRDSVVEDLGLNHLHIAVNNRNFEAVRNLLDGGADVNRAILQADVLALDDDGVLENAAGATPLDLAFYFDGVLLVELLMRRGADLLVKGEVEVDRLDSNLLRPLVSMLDHEDSLFERLEKEIGLTMLHVACSRRDVDLVKALLDSGADVNAQINVKSRIWPGYTPLHVVMDDPSQEGSLDEIVRLLLSSGADVTLTTCAEGETAVYLGYQRIPTNLQSNLYSCLKMLLQAHQDFATNPTKPDCLSYFHIACAIGDVVTVENFLQHGIDVNQPTDFFKAENQRCSRNTSGATSLHLAAASNDFAMDPMTQLKMVDLLLNYGADVDSQDVHGNTVLHLMAQWNFRREDVILRLVGSKPNVNLRNVDDQTPLEVLITTNKDFSPQNRTININRDISVEHIKSFLKFGCCFNVFNSKNDKGLIAIALSFIPFENLLYLIKTSLVNFASLMQTDEMGRTVIHNIVSNRNRFEVNEPLLSDGQYIAVIEELEKFHLDIDDRDALGRTPLHLAVLFRNVEAVSELLIYGADVNVTDASGKTAFSYIFDSCKRCLEVESLLTSGGHEQYDHVNIFSLFVIHLKKLLFCGLEVNETNEKLMFEAVDKCNSEAMSMPEGFAEQVSQVEMFGIGETRFTFGNFLREMDAVISYPHLPQAEREAVDNFFKDSVNNMHTRVHDRYIHVASILLLQYRKAVKRVELNVTAQSALSVLARMRLPDLCIMEILKFLKNSELCSMIEAAG